MRRIACLVLVFVIAASALAQTPNVPSRVLLNANESMSDTAVVSWRTPERGESPQGQIALASPDPRFVKDATTVPATTQDVVIAPDQRVFAHAVRFTGLKPATEYSYRVGDGKTFSEWIHFRTAHAEAKPFSFIYFGDAQNDIKSLWSRTIRRAFRDLPYADLMLHAGDLINIPTADAEWGEWFEAGGWVHATIPTLATPGNHEYARVGETRQLTHLWRPHFALPANGPAGLEQTAYYVDLQGVRFISLNSNERIAEQTAWLEGVLKSNSNRWTVVTFHHPVYSTAKGRDNPQIRDAWQPLFQKYNVALVLQGHDHAYGRKNVPTGMTDRDPRSGTVYVVSVSGPKMYRLGDDVHTHMPRVAEYTQLYQLVRVWPDRIRFEAYTTVGELYDAFELRKNPDGTQRFVGIKVKAPQRTEPAAGAEKR